MTTELTLLPETWKPVIYGLMEVLNEYAPNAFELHDVVWTGTEIHIFIKVPWDSPAITYAHRTAERILTRIARAEHGLHPVDHV